MARGQQPHWKLRAQPPFSHLYINSLNHLCIENKHVCFVRKVWKVAEWSRNVKGTSFIILGAGQAVSPRVRPEAQASGCRRPYWGGCQGYVWVRRCVLVCRCHVLQRQWLEKVKLTTHGQEGME